jgi:site-specific recombinase XerD
MKRRTLSVLFFIRKTKLLKNQQAPIYLRLTVDGKRSEARLVRSIEPRLWDSDKGRAKGKSSVAQELNEYLNSVRINLLQIHRKQSETKSSITAKSIMNEFRGEENEISGVLELFTIHNDRMLQRVEKGQLARSTHDRYRHSIKILQQFLEERYKRTDYPLKEVDYAFLRSYEQFLMIDRSCQHNSAMKRMKELRKIILEAKRMNLILSDPFDNYTISIQRTEREFLSLAEIESIENLDSLPTRLQKIRRAFLFQCYTGISFTDLAHLTKKDIVIDDRGVKWIKFHRKKTGTSSNVPLLPKALSILNEQDYKKSPGPLFDVPSNQKFNVYLKEIADKAGIDKVLTSHVGRHTFATTVTLSNGVSIETVAKMLGHRKLSTTQVYARVLDSKIAEEMSTLEAKFGEHQGHNSQPSTVGSTRRRSD